MRSTDCSHPSVLWNIVEVSVGDPPTGPAKVTQQGGCKVCGAAVQRDYEPLKVYRSVLAVFK